jgi:hypothetical protein
MARQSLRAELWPMTALTAMLLLWAAPPLAGQQTDSTRARIKPNFGSGLVWVEPLPMTPRELAALLTGKSPRQLSDSTVFAITQHFVEAVAAAEAQRRASGKPDWTTTIGDQPVGLDERWIYIGPLKLPTALLALLPINVMANPTEAAAARKRNSMREDILTAGWRAANLSDMRKAVRALREEKERDREFERNRRTPPPSEGTSQP